MLLGTPQTNYYQWLSDGLLEHGTLGYHDGLPSTWNEPLYPAFLALVRLATGDRTTFVLILQSLVTSLGAVALRRLTLELSGSSRAALVAALLYAFHPYLARQAAAYQCLNLTAPLLIACALQFARLEVRPRAALALGVLFGLLLLARMSLAPLVAATVLMLLLERRPRTAAAVAATAAVLVLPWMARNYCADGTLSGNRAGQNLAVSTSEYSRQLLPGYDIDLVHQHNYEAMAPVLEGVPAERRRQAASKLMFRDAMRYAREHPLDVAFVKARSALYVFAPRLVPFHAKAAQTQVVIDRRNVRVEGIVRRPRLEEAAFTVVAAATLVLAAAGLYLRRRQLWPDRFLLLTLAVFTAVHAVFFPTTRLVAPMYFVLMFYAGVAADAAQKGWTTRSGAGFRSAAL